MKYIILSLAIMFSLTSHAATSGTLLIQGVVAQILSISISPNAPANTSLNIASGGSAILVGTATEQCNVLAGYKIKASSASGGFLVSTTDATKKTAYQMSYDGASYTTLSTTPTQVKNVASLTGLTTASSAIRVNHTAFATAPEGTYNDTITISIEAN